jgi:hypothetical protein
LQAVKPYFSPDDVAKGARWGHEISKELEASRVGLLILTRDNLQAPWLMFEAGAIAKNLDRSKVCPLLFGLEPADITGPLVQFQASRFDGAEMRRVVRMINAELGDGALAADVLDDVFDTWWPRLAAAVAVELDRDLEVRDGGPRSEREILEEVLTLTRSISSGVVRDFAEDRKAVAQDVWKAVTGRLVHPSISDEIENILKSTVTKYDVRYKITLSKLLYGNIPEGFIVLRRELRYSLLNMAGVPLSHSIFSTIIGHTDQNLRLHLPAGGEVGLPRHILFRVDGKELSPETSTQIHHPLDLDASTDPQHEIEIVSDELLRETDRSFYVTLSLAVNLDVLIVNDCPELVEVKRVDFLHPSYQLFRRVTPFRWQFHGAMLPGQSFLITWASRRLT